MTAYPSRRRLLQTTLGMLLLGLSGGPAQSRMVELAASDKRLAEPLPVGAETVRSGELRDGDPVHRGSGGALILKLPDGRHIVRLENLEVVPGPNLLVYLVGHEDPLFPEDVTADFRSLGRLKSLIGDQNYPVPEGVDISAYGSIVVWCDTFMLQFAVAALN
ncbi:MAG: hypothetical protein GKS02_10515 [Alphaproteobacteria bacterium]|nr:hypothetical protein [Alphaproteobacteria bacterium]